jgi:hypothetical protein
MLHRVLAGLDPQEHVLAGLLDHGAVPPAYGVLCDLYLPLVAGGDEPLPGLVGPCLAGGDCLLRLSPPVLFEGRPTEVTRLDGG